jgi:hypothetical protein
VEAKTCWVHPPPQVQGLDHLGTHAPCIELYSRLLPGITNVTDRLRYFSMYPWFVWAFDRRYPGSDAAKFESLLRRADCLLTLISERHSDRTDQDTDRHGTGMVGRQRLVPALREWQADSRLSTYATREATPQRYFQNRLGGLGQYYIGTLQEMQLLDRVERGWIRYTLEGGRPLAEAVERQVDSNAFFRVLEADRVSLSKLDALESFCFCKLTDGGEERDRLADLMLRAPKMDAAGRQRRLSLGVALSMVDESARKSPAVATMNLFQRSVYGRSLGGGHEWIVPASLVQSVRTWALYVRNDMLSIAAQAVFAVALKRMAAEEVHFENSALCSQWFQKSPLVMRVARRFGNATFTAMKGKIALELASIGDIESEKHEWKYSRAALHQYTDSEESDEIVLTSAVNTLAALAVRSSEPDAYALSPFPDEYLRHYPINLKSFADLSRGDWESLSIAQLLGWLVREWGIETHLSIAIRKLRGGQSTFRVRPTERGLEVQDGIPRPTPTNPRMANGLQVLRDLGAIEDIDEGSRLSEFGRVLLREIVDES